MRKNFVQKSNIFGASKAYAEVRRPLQFPQEGHAIWWQRAEQIELSPLKKI